MTQNAIAVLTEAEAEAQAAPTAITPAVRLAIGWLLREDVAEFWQAELWVAALTKQGPDGMSDYCRRRDMAIYLDAWRAVAAKSGR